MHDTLDSTVLKVGDKTIDGEHDLQMQLLDSLSRLYPREVNSLPRATSSNSSSNSRTCTSSPNN